MDLHTRDYLSFAGLKCRIIGTFYLEENAKSSNQSNLDDILSPLIGFVQSHCDSEKAKVLIDAVNEAKEQGPPRLVSFSPAEISTELVPPGERYVKSTAYP